VGGLPTTVKAGLALRGLPAGAPRPPLKPLAEADRQKLAEFLAALRVEPAAV
jgi:4-hydroxy-tetrahydrodipicolinate synthase